jgi:hypothetical protein
MRPRVPSHCRPSRNCQDGDLRAGTVKAQRPRVSAVEAKRRALHGAEHRSSMDRVMAGASAVVQIVVIFRARARHAVRREPALDRRRHSALHRIQYESRFMARSSRTNRIRLSGQYGSDRRAHVGLILRRFRHRLRTRGQSTRDSDTHGVNDPPDRRAGHCKRARPGRSRHVSCPDCDIRAFQWAAKSAAHTERRRPARLANCAWRISCGHPTARHAGEHCGSQSKSRGRD